MNVGEQIIQTAVDMARAGLVTGTVGNVSARLDRRQMLITPSRRYPHDLRPADLVTVCVEADDANRCASTEWRLHATIYRARPDVMAIVHTHSPYALARSFDLRPLVVETEEREYLQTNEVRVAEPKQAGSRALATDVADVLGPARAVLISRHGVVGTGRDPRDALAVCAAVEHQALIAHVRLVASLGSRNPPTTTL